MLSTNTESSKKAKAPVRSEKPRSATGASKKPHASRYDAGKSLRREIGKHVASDMRVAPRRFTKARSNTGSLMKSQSSRYGVRSVASDLKVATRRSTKAISRTGPLGSAKAVGEAGSHDFTGLKIVKAGPKGLIMKFPGCGRDGDELLEYISYRRLDEIDAASSKNVSSPGLFPLNDVQ